MRHFILLSLTAAVALSGCAGLTANHEALDRAAATRNFDLAEAQERLQRQRDAATRAPLVEEVAGAFIGSKKVAASKNSTMPQALRRGQRVTMSFSDGRSDGLGNVVVPLSIFAQRIYMATGIPTRVKTDALTDGNGGPVEVIMRSDFQGSVADLFDQIQGKYRVYASYNEKEGVLEFYRTITRQFLVGSPPGETDASIISASGGNEGGFNASVSTTTKTAFKPSAGLIASVKTFTSKGVEPILNESTGTMTVTDTPDAIEAITAFLETENRLMTRQVVFDVKVVRYTDTNDGQSGLDWSLMYNQISALSGGKFALTSPASAVISGTGGLGITATPNSSGRTSRFDSSQLFIQALNVSGKVAIVRNTTLSTLNRRPAMQAFNKTFDYVNETTASATQAGVATGQKTKTENAGRVIFLTPAIVNDRQASVDLSIKESVLNPFKTNTIGSGQSQQTVQLLDKDTDVARETIIMSDGETHITAITTATTNANERSLDKNISGALGGLVQGQRSDEHYFLLVTMRFVQ